MALNMADWQADQRALKEADRQSKQQATATLQSFQNTYVAKSTLSALQKEGREKQRMAQEQNHNYRASFTGTAGTAAGGGSNKTKIEREVQQADIVMGDSREDVFMPTTGIKVSDVVANLNHHQPSEEEIAMDPPVPPPIVEVAEDVASGINVSGALANLKLQPKEEEIVMDPVAPPTIVKVAPNTADVAMGDSREDVATAINVSGAVTNLDHQPNEEEEIMMAPPAPPPIVKVDPTTRADVAMRDSREDVTTGINVSGAVTNFNLQPKEEEEEEIVLDPPAAPTVVKVAPTPPPTVVAPTTGINVSDVVTNIGEDEIEAEGMVMVENPHRDSDEWVSVPPPDDPFSLSTVKHSNVSATATVVAPTLTNVDFTFAVLSFEQPPHVEKYLRAAAFIVGVEDDATLKSMQQQQQQQASTGDDRPCWVHKYLVTATVRVCLIGHSHVEAKQHVLGLLKTAVQDGSFFSIASSPPPDDKE